MKRSQWKIDQKGAPSPRAYLSLVNKWASDLSAWTNKIYRSTRKRYEARFDEDLNELEAREFADVFLTELESQKSSRPPRPGQDDIEKAGRPMAKQSVRLGAQDLRKAGAPDRVFRRLIPGAAENQKVNAIDLFDAGIGVDTFREWAAEGASYITKLDAEYLPDLSAKVLDTARSGARWESLVADIQAAGAKNEAHARLIAQDQVGKLNGRITEELHRKAGARQFTWRANSDSRTRASHAAVDGLVFDYDAGAPGVGFYGEYGLPGQCGRCRCTAEIVPPPGWDLD